MSCPNSLRFGLLVVTVLIGLTSEFAARVHGISVEKPQGANACGIRDGGGGSKLNPNIEPIKHKVTFHFGRIRVLDQDGSIGRSRIEFKIAGEKTGDIYLNLDPAWVNIIHHAYVVSSESHLEGQKLFARKVNRRKVVPVAWICINTELQVIRLNLKEDLEAGSRGELIVDYGIQYGSAGLRRIGADRMIFDGDHARQVFPCFEDSLVSYELEVMLARNLKLTNEKRCTRKKMDGDIATKVHCKPTPMIQTKDFAFKVEPEK